MLIFRLRARSVLHGASHTSQQLCKSWGRGKHRQTWTCLCRAISKSLFKVATAVSSRPLRQKDGGQALRREADSEKNWPLFLFLVAGRKLFISRCLVPIWPEVRVLILLRYHKGISPTSLQLDNPSKNYVRAPACLSRFGEAGPAFRDPEQRDTLDAAVRWKMLRGVQAFSRTCSGIELQKWCEAAHCCDLCRKGDSLASKVN